MSRFFLAALALVSFSQCKLINFDVTQPIGEQRVQGSPLGGFLPSLFPQAFAITINVKQETEARGTGPATSAKLKSLKLASTPVNAPSGPLDFIESVDVFVASTKDSRLEKKKIATLSSIPKGAVSVEFEVVPDVDLLPYINAGAEISTAAKGTQPSRDVTFDGQVVITVSI